MYGVSELVNCGKKQALARMTAVQSNLGHDDADLLHQMPVLNTKLFMVSPNLTYNDKMSTASSMEVCVPFVDPELVEFVAGNIPPNLKLKGFFCPTTKYTFPKTKQEIRPREGQRQRRGDFGAPVGYCSANDLKAMVDDLLCERLRERGLSRPEMCSMVEQRRSDGEHWSSQTWHFLTLNLWMQASIDGAAVRMIDGAGAAEQVATV